jgi:dephospho-CoA kinase
VTYRLGLTGSIGMGKSTTAQVFQDLGYPVWDADAAVHRLYASGGAAVQPVAAVFPTAVQGAAIDRTALKAHLDEHPGALRQLEEIVHPLVRRDREEFIAGLSDHPLVVLDIPLLFETGAEAEMDGVAVVSTDAATQRQRVLARPGMSEELLALILSRQIPDAEKRARADWIIPTDTLEGARIAVARICQEITPHA